jgi:hypothetical protein
MSTVPPDELVDELPDELLDELLLQPTTARATAAKAAIAEVRLIYLPLVDFELSGCRGALSGRSGPMRQPRDEQFAPSSKAPTVGIVAA